MGTIRPPTRIAKRGQPTKYCDATVSAIVAGLRQGLPRRHAARLGGISHETFSVWLFQHPEFSAAVETAEAAAVAEDVASIRRQGQESWQALAWLLERTHREEFGRPVSDIRVTGGLDHRHVLAGLSSVDAWGKAVAELAPAMPPETAAGDTLAGALVPDDLAD